MNLIPILLRNTQNVPDEAQTLVEEVTRQDPLLGAIVGVLLLVITILAIQYYREIRRKDKTIDSISKKLDKRTDFIIDHVKTSIGIIDNLTRMVEVISSTIDEHHGEIRSDLRTILLDLRTHVTVLKNLPHLAKASEIINERQKRDKEEGEGSEEEFEERFHKGTSSSGKRKREGDRPGKGRES